MYGASYRVKSEITIGDLLARTQHVIGREVEIVRNQLMRNHVDILTGTAKNDWINGRNEVQARDARYEFVNADGDRPRISLDETFSYSIAVKGSSLVLTLVSDGETYTSSIRIGGGWSDNHFYFKTGLYLGTNESNSRGARLART